MSPKILHISCLSIFLLLPVILIIKSARAEFFSATALMEPLIETRKKMIDDIDDYILKEEKRLAVLKGHLDLYRTDHEQAMEDLPNYLGNPINAFTLIRRLTMDLDDIEYVIEVGTEYMKNITLEHADVSYPTLEELAGAAQGLVRLQTTYQLDAHDLAEGILNGTKYSYPMTAEDCFALARALYDLNDYNNSLAWSMESLRKFKEESFEHTFTEVELLEYISISHYHIGDDKTALEWTHKLLELDPRNPRGRGNVPLIQKTIEEKERAANKKQGDIIMGDGKPKSELSKEHVPYYEALCRGEMNLSRRIVNRLHCRYVREHHPFLRLAPIKAEQVHSDPDIFFFHEVLSDRETELIKNTAMPGFKRATVSFINQFKSKDRICQTSFLPDEKSDVIARVSQRVADMTGLSVKYAEELQVANYGIGGQYWQHHDSGSTSVNPDLESGYRIATVLFYMSDVAEGGATVFTELGLSVFPVKGAALFWLNLHPSGEWDMAMFHAACPVLRGSKWIATKWIRQSGQELIKPCNLDFKNRRDMK